MMRNKLQLLCAVALLLLLQFSNFECRRSFSSGSRSYGSGSRSFGLGSRTSTSSVSRNYGRSSSSSGSTSAISSSILNSRTRPSSHVPSAPPLSSFNSPRQPGWSTGSQNQHGLGSHSSSNLNKPPQPGWSPSVTSDAIQKHHIAGVNSAPNSNKPPQPGWNPAVMNNGHQSHSTSGVHSSSNVNKPPQPGWNPAVTNNGIQNQHVSGVQSSNAGRVPPPYTPGSAPPVAGQAPPPYPGLGSTHYNPHEAPPPYSSAPHFNQPPPTYSGAPRHYPTQQGAPGYYHQPYYPQSNYLPPPPPGFSPYGSPIIIKEKSGISGTNVLMGLAMWELLRPSHHYGGGYSNVHHHHYYNDNPDPSYAPNYHDSMRERYTTRTNPNPKNSGGPAAYNILEMTHYITPDNRGVISSSEGNMTCISIYNAKSISDWHQKQVNDFHKLYPNSTFPLYVSPNDTNAENFTIIPGRIIHKEPVSITCCGTDKGPIDLNLLTSGKHSNVNCVSHTGHIPIKRLSFIKVMTNVTSETTNTTSSTPTPLAPYPPNYEMNVTTSTPSSTNVDLTQTFSPLGLNNESSTTNVDLSQTFAPLGVNITA